MDLFEQASRIKLRFTTINGTLSVEDLWSLPLECANRASLDSVARDLFSLLKEAPKKSFVSKTKLKDAVIILRLDIVKYIIKVRLEEVATKESTAERKAERQELLGILAEKRNDARRDMSELEIEERLKELDA